MRPTYFILLLATTLLGACRNSEIQPDQARLSGIISPAVSGYVTVTAGPVLDSARVSRKGSFHLDVAIKEPTKVLFFFGKQITSVLLEPGKELILKLNPATFPEKMTYEGSLGPVNYYLSLANKLEQKTLIDQGKLFSMLPLDFIRITDSIKLIKVTLLEQFADKYSEIDPEFVTRTRLEFELSWANQRIQYPDRHRILTGLYPELPSDYHPDYLNTMNLNRAVNLASSVFKDFILNYLDYRQARYLDENPKTWNLVFPESVARFRVIHLEFTDPELRDWLLYQALNDQLSNYGTAYMETFVTDFQVTCRNPEYLKSVETMVANLEKVSAGKPAPDFTAYTVEGKKARLSQYFGKLLYIGFWASWSDGSLQEIPFFEQLRKEFAGREITFIMVSLDFEKDKNKWAAIVSQNNLGGIQLMHDPTSTVLTDQYYLNDFPRYFLIDKDGRIISVHAPRPVENVRETLNRITGSPRSQKGPSG